MQKRFSVFFIYYFCTLGLLFSSNEFFGSFINAKQCSNGVILSGSTPVENILNPELICRMFPIWSWSYPIPNGTKGNTGGSIASTCESAAQMLIDDLACAAQSHDAYKNFLNNSSHAMNVLEAASFFAHLTKETGGLSTIVENTGDIYCSESDSNYKCVPGKSYKGRGFLQLSWNYNYQEFSQFWFKDPNVLLNDPDQVEKDLELAWAASLWFWHANRGTHVNPCLYRDDMVKNTITDGYGFGNSISVINGSIECSTSAGNKSAEQRIYMVLYLIALIDKSVLPPDFLTKGESVLPAWFSDGCPKLSACPLTCQIFNDYPPSDSNTFPYGWNDKWMGKVDFFRCSCPTKTNPDCNNELIHFGKPTNRNVWPWNLDSNTPEQTTTQAPPTQTTTQAPPTETNPTNCEGLHQCYIKCFDL